MTDLIEEAACLCSAMASISVDLFSAGRALGINIDMTDRVYRMASSAYEQAYDEYPGHNTWARACSMLRAGEVRL